ncbi:hypothetical protein HDV62DRAFT_392791 [Trichoderma sp. SZMC 28011]
MSATGLQASWKRERPGNNVKNTAIKAIEGTVRGKYKIPVARSCKSIPSASAYKTRSSIGLDSYHPPPSMYSRRSMNSVTQDSAAGPAKPLIFVLTLGDDQTQLTFQESHASFLNELFERAIIWHAKTTEKAFTLFTQCSQPHAIFVADGGIAHARSEVISQRLVQYAASGGIVVFGGVFAGSSPESLKKIMRQTWDLPWEIGSKQRSTLSLNSQAVSSTLQSRLPASYSQMALSIYGMQLSEAWYLSTEYSTIERRVPTPKSIVGFNESPVVFARYGNGQVGFIGDVKPEDGTILAMLAMLGLLIE